MYARADLLNYKHHEAEAIAVLDSIPVLLPGHPILDDALFKKAEILLNQGNVRMADSLLEIIYTQYTEGVLADSALMKRAEIRDYIENDREGAMAMYQELLEKFPGSVYAVDARKRYRILRGDKGF
jgi:outer membrane protein assembly factor BamD (BamD/ComL family)